MFNPETSQDLHLVTCIFAIRKVVLELCRPEALGDFQYIQSPVLNFTTQIAGSGFQPSEVLSSLSVSGSNTSVFVDVGGSTGHVSIQIARSNPKWKFIVQDSSETVTLAKSQVPEDVKDQLSFQVHDLWTEQPVRGADVYFFKTIFHDWSDTYSVKTLRALILALKDGARIIIADICIPPRGAVSLYKEQWMRGLDLVMKCFANAKERDFEEWAALFAMADTRFKFLGVRTPPGSKASFIEAEWRPFDTLSSQSGGI
ncbi:hypothetical protein SNOG_10065 [Parastagonospora nodorum SN15]|uniref:O-methyltransferase C-terminal domain-containing protein n=1 Tax=Phaeosphaeria nodorum (strain SN15 / ATCC MYA-4574 / FGSC 10173) TaxID=321614 RepID=Q0UDU9_PHANO|nr:hypothetical protein SNOG_10065 [Parastagonospora nodorum SN15]EAT82400.1 hypothetical protein SNOG_10065 [Parastagonospora nodorum SN15]